MNAFSPCTNCVRWRQCSAELPPGLMSVPMMHVREMRMGMSDRLVPMPVAVLGAGWQWFIVGVLMVFVVFVFVRMIHRFVGMCMTVLLGQVQPDTQRHKRARDH